nr:hypothetical protein [Tanacetum cinerariifolium]
MGCVLGCGILLDISFSGEEGEQCGHSLMSPIMKKRQKDKGTEVMKYKVSQEHICEEDVPLNNNIGKQSGELVACQVKQLNKGYIIMYDEINGAKGEQVSNHVVKKGNLEFLVCKQVANQGGDELVDKGRPLKRKRVYAE